MIPLGPFDPMKNVFLPLVISNPLLVQAALVQSATHLAALYSWDPTAVGSVYRSETVRMLNERLKSPSKAVTDDTIAAVISLATNAVSHPPILHWKFQPVPRVI
jgi:hypothetical protein